MSTFIKKQYDAGLTVTAGGPSLSAVFHPAVF